MHTRRVFTHLGWIRAAFVFATLSVSALAQTDIRNFGARCDGSDDSGAVQAALNSVPNGGTVVISCSAGIGRSGIVLANKSNVTVTGNGGSSGFRALANTGLAAGGFGPVLFKVANCSGCTIKDMTIDNRNAGPAGIGFEGCSRSTIQNVSIFNTAMPTQAGIVASGGNGNAYIGNTIRYGQKGSNDGVRGMWIGNGGSQTELNATIADNTIADMGATGIATHVNNAVIRGNLVTNSAGAGIKVSPTSGLGGQTTISGNTVRGNLFHGIQVSKADSPVIVEGNTIDGNAIAGVYASDGAFYGRISGNTITNHKEAAIYLYNGNNLVIDNNQISGNNHGLLIETPPGYNINGLQVTSNYMTGQRQNGITIWGRGGSLNSMSITSNAMANNSSYGVFIEVNSGSVSGVSASGNCFSNNSSGTIFDNTYQIRPVASSGRCDDPSTTTNIDKVTVDRTAPSVAITAPGNGATVSNTISLTASASDNVAVTGVQFLLNGAAYGPKLTSAPYSVQWDTRTVSNGSYQWSAVAQDAAGNSTTSSTVFTQVSNADTTAPTVRIVSPASGATVSATVAITATASDNIGVAGVQFLLNGAAYGPKLTSAPYSVQWDTRTVSNGSYQWSAVAQDAAGNSTTSSTVFTQVSNADTTAPTVRLLTPANGATVSGTVAITASASDNIGVAGVQYTLNGAALGGEVKNSPYAYVWNTSGRAPGNYTIAATARDAAGNRSSVSVTVTIADTTAPTVRITAPGGGTVSGAITLAASASDNVGVAGVQFVVDGANFGAESTSGYSVSCDTRNLSNGAHSISAIARDAAGNRATAAAVTVLVNNVIVQPPPANNGSTTTTAVYRINAGGGSYTDPSGNLWAADSKYNGGYVFAPGKAVSNTSTPALYQTQRWNDRQLIYDFPVENGNYTVNLKFAELYFGGANQRVFNITINGLAVLNNFDIVQAAGGPQKAVDRSFNVNVVSGRITIQMVSTIDDPAVNAIEILKVTNSTPTVPKTIIRVNSGGGAYKDPSGNTWSADYGFLNGMAWGENVQIANTNTPALYQTCLWDWDRLGYRFNVPNGTYTVNLKFAEIWFTSVGARVFDITINGQKVLKDFDMVKAAGGPFRAVDKAFTVNVTNGVIEIQMNSTVDEPQINAIEIFN